MKKYFTSTIVFFLFTFILSSLNPSYAVGVGGSCDVTIINPNPPPDKFYGADQIIMMCKAVSPFSVCDVGLQCLDPTSSLEYKCLPAVDAICNDVSDCDVSDPCGPTCTADGNTCGPACSCRPSALGSTVGKCQPTNLDELDCNQCCCSTGSRWPASCNVALPLCESTDHDCDDEPSITSPGFDYSGVRFSDLQAILTPVTKILYYAALIVGVLSIIYSGYILMTSEGNPQRVQQGQEQLTASILGILFILLSAAILRVIIKSVLGVL